MGKGLEGVQCVDCENLTTQACEECGSPYCGCSSDTDDSEHVCGECQDIGQYDDDDEDDEDDDDAPDYGDDDDEDEQR